MSTPSQGNYFIVNQAPSDLDGNFLAINYNGNGTLVNVVDLQGLPTQVWTLTDLEFPGSLQSISPAVSPDLQIGMGDGGIEIFPEHAYVWYITEAEGAYVIQDGSLSYFWTIEDAVEGTPVLLDIGVGTEKQSWLLISADAN